MKKDNSNSSHSTVNIISFVEECPSSNFPVWYKYEASEFKESQQYKDKPVIEKGWVLYENLFCNMGKVLKGIIKTEADYAKYYESKIKKEENAFQKYIPSLNELREFEGPDFISLEKFIKYYVEMIDVELDEDIIWPYQWPMNI